MVTLPLILIAVEDDTFRLYKGFIRPMSPTRVTLPIPALMLSDFAVELNESIVELKITSPEVAPVSIVVLFVRIVGLLS